MYTKDSSWTTCWRYSSRCASPPGKLSPAMLIMVGVEERKFFIRLLGSCRTHISTTTVLGRMCTAIVSACTQESRREEERSRGDFLLEDLVVSQHQIAESALALAAKGRRPRRAWRTRHFGKSARCKLDFSAEILGTGSGVSANKFSISSIAHILLGSLKHANLKGGATAEMRPCMSMMLAHKWSAVMPDLAVQSAPTPKVR